MSVSTVTVNKLKESLAEYETLLEMLEEALDDDEKAVKVKQIEKDKSRLEISFLNLSKVYKAKYKEEALEKVTEDEFNSLDEKSVPKFRYNDTWYSAVKKRYVTVKNRVDDKIEAEDQVDEKDDIEKEEKLQLSTLQDTAKKERLGRRIVAERKSIEDFISDVVKQIDLAPEGSILPVRAQVLQGSLRDLESRLEGSLLQSFEEWIVALDADEASKEVVTQEEFVATQRARVRTAVVALSKKLKSLSSDGMRGTGEKVFLKKQDVPKFGGDILEYPEFQRRWKALVSPASLGTEAELDRLRDSVPDEAKKLLIGQTTMAGAWDVLTKMYGNKTMLANKLKMKLKTIKSAGKEDHDIVLKLIIEVKGIVNRLTSLGLHEMLKYDDEYISAIFKALPSSERIQWLKFSKSSYSTEWEALMDFLEVAHNRANDIKAHLTNYAAQSMPSDDIKCNKCHKKGHIRKNCTAAAVNLKKDSEDTDDDEDNKTQWAQRWT